MSGRRYEIRRRDGKLIGPLGSKQIRVLASNGEVGPADEIRDMEKDRWQPLSKVGGLVFVPMDSVDVPVSEPADFSPPTPPVRPPVDRRPASGDAKDNLPQPPSGADQGDPLEDPHPPVITIESADVDMVDQTTIDQPTDEGDPPVGIVDDDDLESIPSPEDLVTQQEEDTIDPVEVIGEEDDRSDQIDSEVTDDAPQLGTGPIDDSPAIPETEAPICDAIEVTDTMDPVLVDLLGNRPEELIADTPVIEHMCSGEQS